MTPAEIREPLTANQVRELEALIARRRALNAPVLQSPAVLARQRELDAEIAQLGGARWPR